MMDGGKYADDGPSKLQRIVSVSVVIFWFAFIHHFSGIRLSVRYLVPSFLALACIWFPAAMTNFRWSRHFPGERSHPAVLRFAAWFYIAFVPLIPVIVGWALP